MLYVFRACVIKRHNIKIPIHLIYIKLLFIFNLCAYYSSKIFYKNAAQCFLVIIFNNHFYYHYSYYSNRESDIMYLKKSTNYQNEKYNFHGL